MWAGLVIFNHNHFPLWCLINRSHLAVTASVVVLPGTLAIKPEVGTLFLDIFHTAGSKKDLTGVISGEEILTVFKAERVLSDTSTALLMG